MPSLLWILFAFHQLEHLYVAVCYFGYVSNFVVHTYSINTSYFVRRQSVQSKRDS